MMIASLPFLFEPPEENLLYIGSYSVTWVSVSVLLAILASYVALIASTRISHQHEPTSRLLWTLIGTLTLGIGSWAMHFIGMLSLSLPCGIYYDPLITLISMVPGILAGVVALSVAWHHEKKHLSPLLGSILLGLGIGTMHYTGMAAMRLDGFLRYDPSLFALSIVVAVALSYLALYVKNKMACFTQGCNLVVAGIMGLAISGMHYTAMSATYFIRGEAVTLPAGAFSTDSIATLITLITVFLALAALSLAAISRNREMTAELRSSEERWKFALEGAGDGVWDWNPQTDEALFSKRWKEIIGYAEHEFPLTGTAWIEHLHPEDKDRTLATIEDYFAGKQALLVAEYRMRCKDGTWKWVLSRGKIVKRDIDGKPLRMIGTQTDITDQKQAENALHIAATAFEAQEGILVTDADSTILRVNRAFSQITGYSAEEVIGKTPRLLNSGRHDVAFYEAMWQSVQQSGIWSGEVWNRRKNGEIYPEHLNITAVKNQQGIITNYVATFNDISLSKAAADEIKHLAFYDPLTHLPNRRLLLDRLRHALGSISGNNRSGALLFIDLDHFKTLNDTLGHDIGDMLLQQVALRIDSCVREGDTVARLGGDEFVVMLEDLNKTLQIAASQAESIGEKIIAKLNQPYQLGGHECHSTPSIGVTLFDQHEQKTDDLFKQADIAMYQAKKSGRNTLRFFDPAMQAMVSARVSMESELRHAIVIPGQLMLYYQAQTEGADGHVIGAEALARWRHPTRGFVSPAEFIPLAEETGLILPLGHWVLSTACAQLAVWTEQAETARLSLSVNISAKQFRLPTFVEEVLALIEYHGVDPSKLKLEITESLLLDNVEEIIYKINSLKANGIKFSLDDFGTGYSSLQYLKRLPIDQLKIDQSFVRDIGTDAGDKGIVRTIIAMAQGLKLDIIAEGVETEVQQKLLLDKGCMHYQGYLFGKPLPIEEFNAALK